MKKLSILFLLLFIFLGCVQKPEPGKPSKRLKKQVLQYVRTHYKTPEDYIISQFDRHDVVFVGEFHRLKHDVRLIQHLIPLLYKKGVYVLCTEFARREDQKLIDKLINDKKYDEALARRITFQQFVFWGYREYVDIFRAAWQLNHALPQNAPPFRIFALNDSPDWSFIKSQEDRDNGEIMKKVWKGGGEDLWAKVILEEVVAKGRKTLVYCGIHHAFTEYKQPIYDEVQKKFVRFEDTRAGNYIYNEIGKKAITIYLNAPWPSAEGYDKSYVLPADGFIEASLRDLPAESCRVGFDTKGTPFGTLTGETSIYKYGYQNFTLDKFCDGYIYQIPISQYQGVTPLPDFINTKNINYARKQSPNPWFRNASVEDFNEAIEQDANITKRFEHLRKK